MRDACSERDLLLSLRFASFGLDCIVRRRVNDLGLRRRVRGCRAGLHSRRITRSYVLTSVAPDCLPSSDYPKSTTASRCCCHHRCWFRSFITAIVLMLRRASRFIKSQGSPCKTDFESACMSTDSSASVCYV